VEVTETPGAAFERIAPNVGLTPEQARVSPHLLVGSVSEICDALLARRERWGLSNIVVPVGALARFAPVVARLPHLTNRRRPTGPEVRWLVRSRRP
jgi:hypothetical protein